MQSIHDSLTPGYRILDHTADVGLEFEAGSLPELFTVAADGLMHLICPHCQIKPLQSHALQVCGENLEELLVNWLSELNYLCQVQRFLTARVEVREIHDRFLQADVLGERCDPLRHTVRGEIKAVTYHRIEVRHETANQWRGRVFFDI
ncbi:MAG TPA: archease [bacterium]|nr:archease [bacterium]HQG46347.1 archease [bacterium]HQI48066.1 archease [bacterium]HQJ63316.1 archease [bacterium]